MRNEATNASITGKTSKDWLVLPSGLHVPPSSVLARQYATPGIGVYILPAELGGQRVRLGDIVRTLKRIGVQDILQSLSHIGLLLENHGVFNRDLQLGLAKGLLPPKYREQAMRVLQTRPDRFVFFEQQILSLMQLAVLYCPDTSPNSLHTDTALFDEFVLTCILGVSDVLESTYLASRRRDDGVTAHKEELTSALLRNLFFNYHDNYVHMLGRSADLFVELAEQMGHSPNYTDIPGVFRECTGLALDTYLALGLGVAAWFLGASGKVGQRDLGRFHIDSSTCFRDTVLAPEAIRRGFSILATDLDTYRRSLLEEIKETREPHYSFVTMRQSPLLRLDEHKYVPLSFRFLKERMTTGIYWIVHDYLQGEERLRFTRFFGELFQRYVLNAIGRAYPKSSHLVDRVHPEKRYGGPGLQKDTSDVMILYGEDVVFIEVIASRLKMIESAISGNLAAFRQDLRDKVISAARQIERVVHDFKHGHFTLNGVAGQHMRRPYPVVVSFGTIPQTLPIWHEIEEMLSTEGILQPPVFSGLHLLDVEELEMLEALIIGGSSLVEILDRKLSHQWYRYWPMKTFLAHEMMREGVHNEYLHGRLDDLMRSALNTLGLGGQASNG